MTGRPVGVTGRAVPCLVSGGVMLAVPALLALLAPRAVNPVAGAALGWATALVLLVGAGAVAAAVVRPQTGGAVAVLAVVCAGLALLLSPPEPWAAGVAGSAALAFLLMLWLHGQAIAGPVVHVASWLAARRPLLLGALVTTAAALAAALVPAAWSLPMAGLVGLVVAGVCTAVLARG